MSVVLVRQWCLYYVVFEVYDLLAVLIVSGVVLGTCLFELAFRVVWSIFCLAPSLGMMVVVPCLCCLISFSCMGSFCFNLLFGCGGSLCATVSSRVSSASCQICQSCYVNSPVEYVMSFWLSFLLVDAPFIY